MDGKSALSDSTAATVGHSNQANKFPAEYMATLQAENDALREQVNLLTARLCQAMDVESDGDKAENIQKQIFSLRRPSSSLTSFGAPPGLELEAQDMAIEAECAQDARRLARCTSDSEPEPAPEPGQVQAREQVEQKMAETVKDLTLVRLGMTAQHPGLKSFLGTSTEAQSHNEESLLLTTGGFDGHSYLSSVEVYPSTSSCFLGICSSSCSPPPLPHWRLYHTTFLTSEPNPVPATCGGKEVGVDTTASCLVLDKSSQHWNASRMGDLIMPREFSAVATLNSVGVFIIGGNADNNSRTSNFLAST